MVSTAQGRRSECGRVSAARFCGRLFVAVVFLGMAGGPAATFVAHAAVATQRVGGRRLIIGFGWAGRHSGCSRFGSWWLVDGPAAGVSAGVVRFTKSALGVDFAHAPTLLDWSDGDLLTRGCLPTNAATLSEAPGGLVLGCLKRP